MGRFAAMHGSKRVNTGRRNRLGCPPQAGYLPYSDPHERPPSGMPECHEHTPLRPPSKAFAKGGTGSTRRPTGWRFGMLARRESKVERHVRAGARLRFSHPTSSPAPSRGRCRRVPHIVALARAARAHEILPHRGLVAGVCDPRGS